MTVLELYQLRQNQADPIRAAYRRPGSVGELDADARGTVTGVIPAKAGMTEVAVPYLK
jgi:hypothetical protein